MSTQSGESVDQALAGIKSELQSELKKTTEDQPRLVIELLGKVADEMRNAIAVTNIPQQIQNFWKNQDSPYRIAIQKWALPVLEGSDPQFSSDDVLISIALGRARGDFRSIIPFEMSSMRDLPKQIRPEHLRRIVRAVCEERGFTLEKCQGVLRAIESSVTEDKS